MWNRARWTETEVPWLAAFDALHKPYRRAAGEFPAEGHQWRLALQETRLFAPLSEAEVDYVHQISADGFVALVASWSWIANLSDQHRTTVLSQVRELVGGQSELRLRYCTEIYWTRLT